MRKDAPLFVIGSPRSGTSLIRLVLTCHPQILIPPECGFIIWLRKKYGNWNVGENNKRAKLNSFIHDLFQCKKFDTWLLSEEDVKKNILANQPSNYADLCGTVYLTYGFSIQKTCALWGDKNNFYLNHLEELRCLYKKAHFLHIVRDGRDVACSYREVMSSRSKSPYKPNLPLEIQEIAEEWKNNVTKIDSFISSIPDRYSMTVSYEKLTSHPSIVIKNICDWLELPFFPEMLDFYLKNNQNKLEPDLTIDWKKRTLQPINSDTVGRYQNVLTINEQEEFARFAESALKKFSYL